MRLELVPCQERLSGTHGGALARVIQAIAAHARDGAIEGDMSAMNSGISARTFWPRATVVAACCVVCICLVCLASCALPWQGSPSSDIQAGENQNGTSITLHTGQTLMVTLGSTYWTIQGSSDSLVLAPVGKSVTSPQSCSAPPGSGCGTVSQAFRAARPGKAQVTASRVSCGEAMRCVGPAGQYQLTVQVTAAAVSGADSPPTPLALAGAV